MHGMAAVEFTILMAFIFAPLVLGTVEIGRVLYQYNNIAKGVRAGARHMSLFRAPPLGTPDLAYDAQKVIAKCMVVFGNTGCTGTAIVPGQLTIDIVSTPVSGNFQLVRVSVTGYNLGYVTKIFTNGGTKAFNDISVTMRQRI